MSVVLKSLEIKSIRGYPCEKVSSVDFQRDLTLFTGPNGGGKTSIIECLTYAVSKHVPPCSDYGKAFVHDSELADGRMQEYVKLSFEHNDRLITATKGKRQKSIQEGRLAKTNYKEKEYYDKMLNYFGISNTDIFKLIMFCHQEDGNWLFTAKGELNKMFTNIFGPLIKRQREDLKRKKIASGTQEKNLVDYKDALPKFRKREEEAKKFKEDAKKYKESIVKWEKRLVSLENNIGCINAELSNAELNKCIEIEKNIACLQTKLDEIDKKILEEKCQFGASIDTEEYCTKDTEELKKDIEKRNVEMKNTQTRIDELIMQNGKLREKKSHHDELVAERSKFLKKVSNEYSFSGFDDGEFTSEQVKSFEEQLHKLHRITSKVEVKTDQQLITVKMEFLKNHKLAKEEKKTKLLKQHKDVLNKVPDSLDTFLQWHKNVRNNLKIAQENSETINQQITEKKIEMARLDVEKKYKETFLGETTEICSLCSKTVGTDQHSQTSLEIEKLNDQIQRLVSNIKADEKSLIQSRNKMMKLTKEEHLGYSMLPEICKLDVFNSDIEAYQKEEEKLHTSSVGNNQFDSKEHKDERIADIKFYLKKVEDMSEGIDTYNNSKYVKNAVKLEAAKKKYGHLSTERKRIEFKILEKEKRKLMEQKDEEGVKLDQLGDSQSVLSQKNLLQDELNEKTGKKVQAKERLKQLRESLEYIHMQLGCPEYSNATETLQEKLKELEDCKQSIENLKQECEEDEKKIQSYHSRHLKKINEIIKKYWNRIHEYDSIEINCDERVSKTGKQEYDYKVCMKQQEEVYFDMRSKCSTGQRVLASVVIRMALIEEFCAKCKILALDEPTAYLDEANTRNVARALNQLVREGSIQLLVTTKDKDFVAALHETQLVNGFYKVFKNENGYCTIKKKIRQISTHDYGAEEEISEPPEKRFCP